MNPGGIHSDDIGNLFDPWLAEREQEQRELAVEVVRAERSLARQRARAAVRKRVVAVWCADAFAAMVLVLPWLHVPAASFGSIEFSAMSVRGVQLPWVLGMGFIAIVVRQIALLAAFAQPERRMRTVLLGVATLTAAANIAVVFALPVLAGNVFADRINTLGPLLFAAATTCAAVWTAGAGQRIAGSLAAPDVLVGMNMAAPEHVGAWLGSLTARSVLRLGGRTLDLPCVRIFGIAAAGVFTAAVVGDVAVHEAQLGSGGAASSTTDVVIALLFAAVATAAVVVIRFARLEQRRPRAATALKLLTVLACAVGSVLSVSRLLAASGAAGHGHARVLVLVLFGVAFVLVALLSSVLYEASRRSSLPADELAEANARLNLVLRPPDVPYYVWPAGY